MALAPNKTKLVCTIGPASESPEFLRQMLQAGMNIARLNFSHGDFAWHRTAIDNLRRAARTAGKRVAIMADFPGPKIRIGQLAEEPIELTQGDSFTLTTSEILGNRHRVFVNFPRLPAVVKPGDCLFLNDGNIQLEVVRIAGSDVECRVIVGGELRSRKGLNLPGIALGASLKRIPAWKSSICAVTASARNALSLPAHKTTQTDQKRVTIMKSNSLKHSETFWQSIWLDYTAIDRSLGRRQFYGQAQWLSPERG